MAFNITEVGQTDKEKETLLRGAGKSQCCTSEDGVTPITSPEQKQAIVIPVKTPSAPSTAVRNAGAEGMVMDSEGNE